MPEEKKQDRRVIKTKKAIYRAFAQLLLEKDINDITIKDVADRADINRKTFYNYYGGIYDLTGEIENKILEKMETAIKDLDVNELLHDPNEFFNKITDVICSDIDFYGHLMRIESNSSLIVKLITSMKNKFKEIIAPQTMLDTQTLDILLDYVTAGMMSVYQHWFNSDRSKPINAISATVSTLTFRGINGLLDSIKSAE